MVGAGYRQRHRSATRYPPPHSAAMSTPFRYRPIRIDKAEFNDRIDDEIIAEIRRSRFLVADFTQDGDSARGGVYYEAGFAHGLDRPVIFTCRKNVIDKGLIHFDTRQYNHIAWTTAEELRKRLADRIAAIIGDGPSEAG